jgi:hypothetical protein
MLEFFNQIAVMPFATALLPFLTVGIVLGAVYLFRRATKGPRKPRDS